MKYNNLLILGATGVTGKWVTQLAKDAGYNVTVLVRSKAKLVEIEGINIIEGSVLDQETLDSVVEGQDAVISCLGITRKNQKNPWSELTSPLDLTEKVAKNLTKSMVKHNVTRVIALSAAGVGESRNKMNAMIKFIVSNSNIRYAYKDLSQMEKIFQDSSVESLIVSPVTLVDDKGDDSITKLIGFYGTTSKISRKDVAKWMLSAVERSVEYQSKPEMIGWN
jgi:putative NADH-flavin reductase